MWYNPLTGKKYLGGQALKKMPVIIERGPVMSRIVTPLPEAINKAVQEVTRYRPEGYQFMPSYKAGAWDGYISLYRSRNGIPRTYPTGLEENVVEAIKKFGSPIELHDASPKGFEPKDLLVADAPEEITLRDYQVEAIDAALSKKRGIVQLPTGTGKTITMAETIRQIGRGNVLIVVYHSKDLLHQTASVMRNYLRMPVGVIGDGKIQLEAVTVAISDRLQRELKKPNKDIVNWLKDVYAVCVDEVHHIRAETVQACANACANAVYRLGFSGTPFRDQGDDLEIQGALAGKVYSKSLTWMVDRGYLCQPVLYRIEVDASGWTIPPGEELDEVYDEFDDGGGRKSKEFMHFQRKYIWENEHRNALIARWAMSLVDKGYRGLVMTTNIEHGRRISELIPGSVFVHGKDSSSVRREVLKDLEEGVSDVVVCTTIYNEGIDCPPASFIIPAQPYRSNVITIQQQGRVLRPYPGKDRAILVDIVDLGNKWYPKQGKARMKYYESEPAITRFMKKKSAKLLGG